MSASLEGFIAPKARGTRARIAVGTMNFGKRTDEAAARRIVAFAKERGLTFLDTANVYNDGESERIVGRAIGAERDRFIIATKVGYGRVQGKAEGLARDRILSACDASLGRLSTDYIDIYYLHTPDHKVPIQETLSAISDLITKGKIRAWGVSNYASWQILEMFGVCDKTGLARPVISQVIYNMVVRQIEIEYTRFAGQYGLHTTIYNPLAAGLLTGRYKPGAEVQKGTRFDENAIYQRRYWSDRLLELVGRYERLAPRGDLVSLAYAWTASRPGVDSILVGPGSVEHLEAAIRGCEAPIADELVSEIDAIHRGYLGTDAVYAR